jgi:hypothetical protein
MVRNSSRLRGFLSLTVVLVVALVACHKEEQAVVGVAKTAVTAEQQAAAAAKASESKKEQLRAQLAQIPLPTKSMYVDVREPGAWRNPFLSVDVDSIYVRITLPDTNTGNVGQGTMLRPEGARRQQLQIRLADLPEALIALPGGAWHYGRVVAVAESPGANKTDRPKLRRNLEAVIQQLNDLGVVVDEWPTR